MSIIKNKKIAIVGGGPGGLTLARILQMKNADVKVYERDPGKDARAQGATLDLHYDSGLKALQEAGLMDAFQANYRPGADRLRIVDKDANVIMDDYDREKGDEHFRPEIDRGPLKKILLESLQPDTVLWNSHFVSLDRLNNAWQLTFGDGTTAVADIVIAADGANSKIRPHITPVICEALTQFQSIQHRHIDAFACIRRHQMCCIAEHGQIRLGFPGLV